MIVLRKPRLVAGSGRRYDDTMPAVGLVSPVVEFVLQLYGSSTERIWNCKLVLDGIGSPILNNPFFKSRSNAFRRLPGVETSSDGHVAPSTRRNSGSFRSVLNRSCACRALTVQPSSGWWQVKQVRLFVPRF